MATPAETLDQLKGLYQNLSSQQKIITGLVLMLVLAGFAALFFFTNRTTYGILYTDLSPESASEVVAWLKQENIPYKLTQGGGTIQVPEGKVYDIRLSLASAGVPKGGGVGFEVFDKGNLGATDFVQHVNYQRAIQGELEKTISQFPQVENVRVHIAQPKESLFVTERREPTASVVLHLKRGQELNETQLKGIAHLVASAVPRLKKENVTIVDTSGDILYEHRENENNLANLTNSQLVYQRRLEEYYKHKIQSMLENVLGPNKAVARVSAEVDFDHIQISEDRFDPDMVAPRSEQKLLETVSDQETGGIPGVKGGLANKLQGNVNQMQTGTVKRREETTTNYEITRIQRQVNGSIGKLKRLSVAVLIDGKYKEENGKLVYVPRSDEELADLRQIVKAAMGYSEERGDDMSVVNVAFTAPPAEKKTMAQYVDMGAKFIKPLVNLIIAILFIFLVLKPLLNRYVLKPSEELPVPAEEIAAAIGEEEIGKLEAPQAFEPGPNVQEELQNLASKYPERAAALIKIWLREPVEG